MTEVSIPVHFEGVDLYCPECQRLLVHVHDGQFDLAGKASIGSETVVDFEAQTATALIVEATCDLRRCRFRRWLRAHAPGWFG